MPLGCLNSNKVIFRNYVNHAETIFGEKLNQLTFARLTFMLQCVKVRRSQQMKNMTH